MRAALNRLAPLAVALFGVALVVLMLQIDDRQLSAQPDDAMLHYSAVGRTAWWILGTSCAIGLGWQALRTRRRSRKSIAALAYVVIWVVGGSALAFDVAYDVLGPGVEALPRTCFQGSRDCIGEPSPRGPILGTYGEFLLGCYTFLSTPLVLLTLVTSTIRSGGAERGRAAGTDLIRKRSRKTA